MRTSLYTGVLTMLIMVGSGSALSSASSTPTHEPNIVPYTSPDLSAAPAADTARLAENYGKLPLSFELNQGQTDAQVKYLSRGAGYSLFLTPREAVLSLSKPTPSQEKQALKGDKTDAPAHTQGAVIRMSLVGSNEKPTVRGQDKLPGVSNYLTGNDPKKWTTGVEHYAKVHYDNVYPGIDLVYYGNQRQLEYDFIVAPGADPKAIQLGFKGADTLEINKAGDLVLHTPLGEVIQHKPFIYQEINGQRKSIEGKYILPPGKGRNEGTQVAFQVASYDKAKPLIIDPILSYSTYLGGSGREGASSIAVDRAGNAYVTGGTQSTDFPTTAGVYDTTANGFDAFVVKLNPSGTVLSYATYLGGSGSDVAFGIALAAGSAYVTGFTTSTNFPTTTGAYDTSFGGSSDAFVVKLNPTGRVLTYSTYLGGNALDLGYDIAVDGTGAYVTGYTYSNDFPTTARADATLGGSFDAFVTKLNNIGTALTYSTYLGGSASEVALGIAVKAGRAYITGYTESNDFPTTPGAYNIRVGGPADAFVVKLNPSGTSLAYATYLGGSGIDEGRSIAVEAGNAYVTGTTYSTNFPTTAGAYDTNIGGVSDAFVVKLSPNGTALSYGTYLGGSGDDFGQGIAVAAGSAYVTGLTGSTDYPTTAGAYDVSFGGISDAFMVKLNPAATALAYATYLGGSGDDRGTGIAVASGSAYVTGSTDSSDFPTTAGAYDSTSNNLDAFIAKFGEPGRLQFSNAYYSVNEGGGSKTIIVKRVGGSAGSVSVHYTTANGSAVAGSDYTARSGTLTWANGNTAPKTFSVPIVNDSAVEPNERVRLILSAPTGGATLGNPKAATLIIINND